jgi:hypothetical protein
MTYWVGTRDHEISGTSDGRRLPEWAWTVEVLTRNAVRMHNWVHATNEFVVFRSESFDEAKEVFRRYADICGADTSNIDTIVVQPKE